VTVQLPIFNEMFVVERSIQSVARMNYPSELLEIQVLDDSTDETQFVAQKAVERLRRMGINIHYLHRSHREGFKAGALEAGLKVAKGEFIAIFDDSRP
jgi:cellulose synthase/poly-beta-1,6-N-acetylglucosamine synthase-like glycosyltransferase